MKHLLTSPDGAPGATSDHHVVKESESDRIGGAAHGACGLAVLNARGRIT